VVQKGAGLMVCKARTASRVAARSVGRAAGAIPRSDHEPTKRPRHPDHPADVRLRGSTEERLVLVVADALVPGSSPRTTRATTTEGARAPYRGGEHGPSRKTHRESGSRLPGPMPFTRRSSAHAARNSNVPSSFPSTEADAIARTVIAAKAATPPQGVRGKGRQKAWLLDVVSGLHGPTSTARWTERDGVPLGWLRASGHSGASSGNRRGNGGATHRTGTRTGATASRGGGFTARGRARASNMRCRDRWSSRSPIEAEDRPLRSRAKAVSGGRGL
jgi:hypothetical protein